MSPYTPVDWSEHERQGGGASPAATPTGRAVFDRDVFCPVCDYNLRGLPLGNCCPECGADPVAGGGDWPELNINAPRLRKLVDVLAGAQPNERRRFSVGLALAALCLLSAVMNRYVFFVGAIAMPWPPVKQYLVAGLVVSIVWAAAIWMILPSSIDAHWPRLRWLRRAVLLTQCLWIPAYGLWMLRAFGSGTNTDVLIAGHLTLRAVAGIGFIGLGQLMVFICEEAELEHAARRFNAGSWLIAFPSLLGQLFVGTLLWIVLVMNVLVLLWWAWMLALYVLGFMAMRQHVVWAQRHRIEQAGRNARIAEKKRAYEQAVERQVRPLPANSTDEPLTM